MSIYLNSQWPIATYNYHIWLWLCNGHAAMSCYTLYSRIDFLSSSKCWNWWRWVFLSVQPSTFPRYYLAFDHTSSLNDSLCSVNAQCGAIEAYIITLLEGNSNGLIGLQTSVQLADDSATHEFQFDFSFCPIALLSLLLQVFLRTSTRVILHVDV